MNIELYFLRSSEQKIVQDMVQLAHPKDTPNLEIYTKFYGLTTKDLGLYALVNNEIAGAIWSRELNNNRDTPVLSLAVLEKFRGQGIGSHMINQFLLEAGSLYEKIIVHPVDEAITFYEKFEFEKIDDSTMMKILEKKEVIRPTDGYDPTRWMD